MNILKPVYLLPPAILQPPAILNIENDDDVPANINITSKNCKMLLNLHYVHHHVTIRNKGNTHTWL